MVGGSMVGCPWLKALFVRVGNFTLYHLARLPTQDASNGFRLFSRRTMDEIVIESDRGFCYSIELLVKCHRLGWQIGEVPARWIKRPMAPVVSGCCAGFRFTCAGTLMRSPRPISGGRRGRCD